MNHGLPYFKFFPADFLLDERQEAMSAEQAGAYIRLLCRAWTQNPPCTIPDDDKTLARMAGVDDAAWARIKPGVLICFHQGGDGRLVQTRLRHEFECLQAKSGQARAAVEKRWGYVRNTSASAPVIPSEQNRAEQRQIKTEKPAVSGAKPPLPADGAIVIPEGCWGSPRWGIVFNPVTRQFVWTTPQEAYDRSSWAAAYPACDIEAEMRKAAEWLLANPAGRKSNYRKYLTGWLSRHQDRGGTHTGTPRMVLNKADERRAAKAATEYPEPDYPIPFAKIGGQR